jgi:glycosyltransferase involved in cell wall biosynthesis
MEIIQKSISQLEILISTMNRTSLDFLDVMFIDNDSSQFQILVINQTHKECILKSCKPNVRVINSLEKGLSKSRNLALQNANALFVLLSDDDVVFEKNFGQIILMALYYFPNANVITFKVNNFDGQPYRNYPKSKAKHSLKTIKELLSVEIVLDLVEIRRLGIQFDERFGLGSEFETAEEYLLVREILKKGGRCHFYNECIVSHSHINSGMNLGSDKIVYARAALSTKVYGFIAYFWLLKYLFFLIRHRYINFWDIWFKWKLGVKGIHDFQGQ